MAWTQQAARRAQVVPPDQLSPEAAKRAMEDLQTEVEGLRQSLAECRDAFPMPEPGAPLECEWMKAMGHAEAVPDYVKACLRAPVVPQGWKLVPVEPTSEMLKAAWKHGIDDEAPEPYYAYKAMLAAAPQPPEADMGIPISQQNQHVSAPVECACGDSYQADSFGAGFIAARGKCPNCDVSEAAPVQLPEASGLFSYGAKDTEPTYHHEYFDKDRLNQILDEGVTGGPHRCEFAYTEHKVRDLLAAQNP